MYLDFNPVEEEKPGLLNNNNNWSVYREVPIVFVQEVDLCATLIQVHYIQLRVCTWDGISARGMPVYIYIYTN